MKVMPAKLFPDANDAYDRYRSLRSADPYANKREKYLQNYNRNPWVRNVKAGCKKKHDPNFGQFKSKVDAAVGTYTNVLTERKQWGKVVPKFESAELVKTYSDRITSAFHRYYINLWEDRFMDEVMSAFDIVMYGKAVEHWPTPGCIYTENVPVERIFPDTGAGMNPKKWAYCFIEKDFYVSELTEIIESEEDSDNEFEFDKAYLKKILEMPEAYAESDTSTDTNKERNGEITGSSKDLKIVIVFAYIKDSFKKKKKISRYCFPAYVKEYVKGEETGENVKYLSEKEEYDSCFSHIVKVRTVHITRSYWKFNSLAEQIFLATAFYDKSFGLAIRASRRNAIMYFKSDNAETKKKLLDQTDDEVQVLDPEVSLVQNNGITQIKEIIELTRQIMMDTENGLAMSQAPGSQNVKGYAITAQEAEIRAAKEGEAEANSLKILLHGDVSLFKEIYRRAIIEHTSEKYKRAYSAFIKEMKQYNIPKSVYGDIDNLHFVPFFVLGGSQSVRVQNAQGLLNALAINPTNPGQAQAQKDLVAAFAGTENTDSYIAERMEVNPVAIKAGQENEALDNPYVNPANVPVLPTDKHAQELPFHVADYEFKLKSAQAIVQKGMEVVNPMQKIYLINIAADLVLAQDTKGGHIQAHIQAMANSEVTMNAVSPLVQRFAELQKQQDAITAQLTKIQQEMDASQEGFNMNTEKERHTKAMNQIAEESAKNLSDINLSNSIEKKKSMQEQREFKNEANAESAVNKLAAQKAQSQIKIENQLNESQAKNQTKGSAEPTS